MQRHFIPAALAWLAAALLALGAWLALPRERDARGTSVHAILVDVSASAVGPGAPNATLLNSSLEMLKRDEGRPGVEFVGVLFGRGARAFDLSRPLDQAALSNGEDRSDLAAGLALCEELARGRRLTGIDVLGDGTWTGTDPTPIADRLAGGGTHIRVGRNQGRLGRHAWIAPLESPIRVRRGEPVRIEVVTWRNVDARGGSHDREPDQLVVTATATEGERVTTREASVAAEPRVSGPRPMRVALELPALESERARLDVGVMLRSDGLRVSPILEGDGSTTSAEIVAAGALVVGVWAESDARLAIERAFASNPGLAIVPVDDSRAVLDGLDVLVTVDVAFDRATAERVDAFVAAGGGWVDLAGERFATGSRPRAAALVPDADDARPREVVVLVDGSGSMAGAPALAARTALAHLVEVARAEDGISAAWFGDAPLAYTDLGRPGERVDPERRRAAIARAVASPEPHGPTRVLGALEELARGLDAQRRRTVVILVSDGREADRADPAARVAALRAQLAAGGAELVVVSAGADPDRDLLGKLAGDGARVLDAGELASQDGATRLAALLERALATGAIVEDPGARAALFTGTAELAAPFASIAPPSVRRHVRVRAQDGAAVAWTSAAGAPLLALSRHGLGVSAGFAFAPDAEWLREPGDVGAAIATAVRAVAPPPDRARPRLVERDGELVLEGVSADAPAIVRAELTAPDGRDLGVIDLLAARAGHDPVHERSAPLPAALASLAAGDLVTAHIRGVGSDGVTLAFSAPRAPEFARPPRTFTPPPARVEARRPSVPAAHPLAPGVLLAGLLALAASAALGFFSRSGRTGA